VEPQTTHSSSDLPSLSISVVLYNTPKEDLFSLIDSLKIAISALRKKFPETQIDTYFIDNSAANAVSSDDFTEWQNEIETGNTRLRILHGHGNIGYGAAHNLVIHKVETDFHLILNPDVVLDTESLVNGIGYLKQNDKTIIVSPYAVDKDGNKQYLCKRYPAVLTFLIRGFFPNFIKRLFGKRLSRYEMHELSETTPGIDIPIVSGCFMLCKTSALQKLNGFDANYFLYFEDFDFSIRATDYGRLDYLPSMQIIHGGGNAARKGRKHLTMFAKSGYRFFRSHGWQFFRQP